MRYVATTVLLVIKYITIAYIKNNENILIYVYMSCLVFKYICVCIYILTYVTYGYLNGYPPKINGTDLKSTKKPNNIACVYVCIYIYTVRYDESAVTYIFVVYSIEYNMCIGIYTVYVYIVYIYTYTTVVTYYADALMWQFISIATNTNNTNIN